MRTLAALILCLAAPHLEAQISVFITAHQNGQVVMVENGGTLGFPASAVGANTAVQVNIYYQGSGTLSVMTPQLLGAAGFSVANAGAFPRTVSAGGSITFDIQYIPSNTGLAAAQFTASITEATTDQTNFGVLTFLLNGSAPAFSVSYSNSTDNNAHAVAAGETIAFPTTVLNSTSVTTVVIANGGSGVGTLTSVSLTGAAFQLLNLPLLPVVLAPNGRTSFQIQFAPKANGTISGQLSLGVPGGNLAIGVQGSTGLNAQFVYAYGNMSLQPGTTIFVPAAGVGTSSQATVTVTNAGNLSGIIQGIQLGKTTSEYALIGLPALPATLNPGASLSFTLVFSPASATTISNQLVIGQDVFTVSGGGSVPAPLPAFQFQGPTGNVGPRQQPAIGLTLSQPYPLPLSGTLSLTTASNAFAADPSVLFSAGSIQASFQIPANTTQAIFASGDTTIRLQTGTVQESIIVTPSFALSNGYDLTPASLSALTLTVPASAPIILQMQITAQTSNSFTLQITGLATTRSIGQLTFQFSPAAGKQLASNQVSVDVQAAFDLWFQSQVSQSFGGLFQFSVPFALGVGTSAGTIAQYLSSVSATLTNAVGTAAAVAVSF